MFSRPVIFRTCRSPRGERGLKYNIKTGGSLTWQKSLPPRGAWIEMTTSQGLFLSLRSRSPRGERGLKSTLVGPGASQTNRRSPRGERGLKYRGLFADTERRRSLPPRGAWIEITLSPLPAARAVPCRSPRGERGLKSALCLRRQTRWSSLPPRGAWIEMFKIRCFSVVRFWSLPPRGAWIEMYISSKTKISLLGRSPRGERGLK